MKVKHKMSIITGSLRLQLMLVTAFLIGFIGTTIPDYNVLLYREKFPSNISLSESHLLEFTEKVGVVDVGFSVLGVRAHMMRREFFPSIMIRKRDSSLELTVLGANSNQLQEFKDIGIRRVDRMIQGTQEDE